MLWLAGNVLLLFFTGILLAVFLASLSRWTHARTGLSYPWSLSIVVFLLLGLCVGTGFLLAPEMASQFSEFAEEIPKAWSFFKSKMAETQWGRQVLQLIPDLPQAVSKIPSGWSGASGFLSSVFGFLANIVIVLFIGLYLAAEPQRYAEGAVRLLPREKRARAREVFRTMGTTLQRWLFGRLLLMAANTVVTIIGLWMLGVPLPVTLGILSGLLNFIPNIGPIVAAIPAVLLAFTQGPWLALYVVIFYFVYQMLDGYVFTPLVEKQTVLVPPALTIMSQVLLGVLAGAMGVVLADPLIAVGLVLVKMLYVEDVLGECAELPGDKQD